MRRESGGSSEEDLVKHHDLCFFVVNAHAALLCPVLAGVYHGLKLCLGSCYTYHVIGLKESSNPIEVIY